jgi:peroxiredoxin
MAKTEPRPGTPLNPPAFEVEITSGGRAYDAPDALKVEKVEPVLSPTRAAAKARARRRNMALAIGAFALLLGLVAWMWLTNPLALVPGDAVARVNGEFILERDVTREMDLRRVFNEWENKPDVALPSAASVFEELLYRRLQTQDARKAGVTVSAEEVSRGMANLLSAQEITEEEFARLLARYNLTLDDVRGYITAVLMNGKREAQVMEAGATEQDRLELRNKWQTKLSQDARIDRFKPAGAGPAPRVGAEAPDFSLKTLDGRDVSLSSLRGRPVMVNFWATWCPPCRAEIPEIASLYREKHNGENFEILGVATQSNRDTIQAFATEFGMTFPLLPDVESRVTSLYHVLPIPTSFFIDKDGIIREMRVGVVDRETMEKWLIE